MIPAMVPAIGNKMFIYDIVSVADSNKPLQRIKLGTHMLLLLELQIVL